jgi:hypothetical protein
MSDDVSLLSSALMWKIEVSARMLIELTAINERATQEKRKPTF